MVYVVDTHALVWFFEESSELGKNALNALNSESSKIIIPTIVLAEIFYLSQQKRIESSFTDIIQAIEQDDRCIIYPLDLNVIRFLPERLNIHDGIICGTALVYKELLQEDIKLITKDKEIRELSIVDTLW
jgi:PIN domain nuclease of toxin-antitoxin system